MFRPSSDHPQGVLNQTNIHNTQIHLCLIYYWLIREGVFLRLTRLLVLTIKLLIKVQTWTLRMLRTVPHSSDLSQHKIALPWITAYHHQNYTFTKLRTDKCLLHIQQKCQLNVRQLTSQYALPYVLMES